MSDPSLFRCILVALPLHLALGLAPTMVYADGSPDYESPPVLRAVDLLPPELVEGPGHRVDPTVPTDGFMARFTIQSDVGTFDAYSAEEARVRIHEIQAILALDEMNRAELAGDAVIEGVKQPFLAVRNVVTQPEETVRNLGDSLGRWLERGKLSLHKARTKAEEVVEGTDEEPGFREATVALVEQEVRDRATDAGDDPDAAVEAYRQRREVFLEQVSAEGAEDGRRREQVEWAAQQVDRAARKYLGYDRARRDLARQLQVDPYSTNLALQERLDAAAWALWAGQFGSGFVVPSVAALDHVETVDDLVWAQNPKDLEVRNRKELDAMGVDLATVDAFFASRLYSPSHRTAMIADLASLDGVENREHFFRLASTAEGWRMAHLFRRTARMLARVHQRQPIEHIVARSENLVVALDRDGNAHLFLPVDHLAWTESFDLLVGGLDRHRRQIKFEGGVVLHLAGDLTATARRGLESFGGEIETWGLGPADPNGIPPEDR